MNEVTLEQLAQARRLEDLGIVIRSAEIRDFAERVTHLHSHGNRAMRRAAKRGGRRRGRGFTR